VRYLVQPNTAGDATCAGAWRHVEDDPQPRTFNVFAGMRTLPPYSVFENPDALPRAFVVPDAAPLPPRRDLLAALKTNDFRRRVFLEGYDSRAGRTGPGASFQPAQITRFEPNRVEVRVKLGAGGFLVLTDPWFPGWSCTVDGQPQPLYRANFLFRAVEVPAGPHEVSFRFAPASFRLGGWISGSAVGVLSILSLAALASRGRRRPSRLSSAATPASRRRPADRSRLVTTRTRMGTELDPMNSSIS
jgi:hypothetical protein